MPAPRDIATGSVIGEIDGPAAFRRMFDVSRETLDALERYESVLRKWQKAHNLVAPGSLDHIWHRHFADSAQLLALAPQARIWLDLGAGAGFPGMVLAIMAGRESGKMFHLVESVGRKCAFLETVKRETRAPVQIHNMRIEAYSNADAWPDIVTARALAPLERLFELSCPHMGPETRLILPKGQDVDNELKAAQKTWNFAHQAIASLTDSPARILIITALQKRSGP
ncbi:MAG: 16S rRNA (guanine(527)-N(7))-methyltransferase RsmG [Fimbriimonadaceae bacterium]|nr:16S rRNA (guanine(527)-N(7))-methyltransferase RsmG [Alphaproteobacteria bacterium]